MTPHNERSLTHTVTIEGSNLLDLTYDLRHEQLETIRTWRRRFGGDLAIGHYQNPFFGASTSRSLFFHD